MTRADLTVISASIPGRELMLAEALASVYAQTREVKAHLVMAQSCSENLPPPLHVAIQRNYLLPSVDTAYVANLNDDDLWLPNHVETVAPALGSADVIYTWDANHDRPRVNCNGWDSVRLLEYLAHDNFIDSNAIMRTDALLEVGGYPTDWHGGSHYDGGSYAGGANFEEWELWKRMAARGMRFLCIPVETWSYRTGEWERISTTA